MSDKTTDTMRLSMRQVVDMAPTPPELPTVPERRTVPRPALALASGFAAVLLFVGVGAALLTDSGTETSSAVGAQTPTAPASDTPVVPETVGESHIVVVFFSAEPAELPTGATEEAMEEAAQSMREMEERMAAFQKEAVRLLAEHPDVVEVLFVDTDAAEAEIRRGLAPGEAMWTDGPGLVPTLRLKVQGDDEAMNGVIRFAGSLDGVDFMDVYVGEIDIYPAWSFQGGATAEEHSVVTTTSIAPAP